MNQEQQDNMMMLGGAEEEDMYDEDDLSASDYDSEGSDSDSDSDISIDDETYQRLLGPRLQAMGPFDGPDDLRRMQLSAAERECALAIKDTIEGMPDIDSLSDFMYGQLALIEGENVQGAVRRARHIQLFREEYGILDTVTDGMRHLKNCVALFPRHLLSYGYESKDDGYALVLNLKGFQGNLLSTPETLEAFVCGFGYYLHTCFCPDLFAIRQGITLDVECHGFDWKEHVTLKTTQLVFSHVLKAYPFRYASANCYNDGLMFNIFISSIKRVVLGKIASNSPTRCETTWSLDEIYLLPTVEAANERLLQQLEKALRLRYQNEQTFSLHLGRTLRPRTWINPHESQPVRVEGQPATYRPPICEGLP